jgi:hypothetical protein
VVSTHQSAGYHHVRTKVKRQTVTTHTAPAAAAADVTTTTKVTPQ